jgi:hypothetical protein
MKFRVEKPASSQVASSVAKFIDMLRSTELMDAPALVQIALQASVHSYYRRIVAARHFNWNRYGLLLTEICRGTSDEGES